jgi:hypothetical protein
MKSLLALLAIGLSGVGGLACGSAGKSSPTSAEVSSNSAALGASATTAAHGVAPGGYLHEDGDKDIDDNGVRPPARLDDDRVLLDQYGGEASDADRQAVTAVVKGYYAAAAAGEATKACSLLYSSLAAGLAAPGQGSGQARSADEACAAGVAPLYEQQHAHLVADDVSTMAVSAVRVKGDLGLAVIGFRTQPQGEILVERERGAWKVDALFDSEMP